MTQPAAASTPASADPRAAASHHEEQDGLPTPRRYFAIAALLSAIVLVVIDGAIANIALPSIVLDLHVTPAASVWVVSGYQLALVISILPFAALGEIKGFRLVFTGGVAVFTVASALCALAPSLEVLVAARVLQGFGGAAVMSLFVGLLRFVYPHRMLGRAIGINALAVALSSALGPTLGASVLAISSWPWLFLINVPVGIIVLAMTPSLPSVALHKRAIDAVSVFLNACGMALFILGVDRIGSGPAMAGAMLAGGLVFFTLLVKREAPLEAPLIPLDLLRNPTIRLSVIASVCCFSAQMLAFVALPFYLQSGLGESAFTTGLLLTPWPLAAAVTAPIAGRLADRMPNGILCAIGGALLALGTGLAAVWPLEGSVLPLILFMIFGGVGFGFFLSPNNRNMLLSTPKKRSGAAGGMQSSARVFGQALGAAAAASFFSLAAETAPPVALGVACLLALVSGGLSLLRTRLPAVAA
jgi:DHA2 family multidrug resistance protein-like MFS transporter